MKEHTALFIDKNTAAYFDSFGIEYISRELLSKIKDKLIIHNIFRIQFNFNMSGIFEGSFFWAWRGGGSQFDPPHFSYFKKNLSNTNIALYNC